MTYDRLPKLLHAAYPEESLKPVRPDYYGIQARSRLALAVESLSVIRPQPLVAPRPSAASGVCVLKDGPPAEEVRPPGQPTFESRRFMSQRSCRAIARRTIRTCPQNRPFEAACLLRSHTRRKAAGPCESPAEADQSPRSAGQMLSN